MRYVSIDSLIFTLLFFCIRKSIYLGLVALCVTIVVLVILDPKVRSLNVKPMFPFFLINGIILFSGAFSMIWGVAGVRDITRDVVTFSFPSLALIFGYYWFGRIKSLEARRTRLIQDLFTAGTLGVIVEIVIVLSNFSILRSADVRQYRELLGTGNDATLIALIFGLFIFQNFPQNSKLRTLLLLAFTGSILFSFSRINFLVTIVCGAFMIIEANNFKFTSRLLISVGLIVFIFFTAVPQEIRASFLNKLGNSFSEVSTQSANFDTWADINNNWRGYEKYRTIQTFKDAGLFNRIFGMGLGARLQLPFTMTLDGQQYSSIPTIHTSYYYILLKSGILGLIAYTSLILSFLVHALHIRDKSQDLFKMLILSFILLAIKGYTEGGLLNAQDSFLLVGVLGYFQSVRENRRRFGDGF